MQEIVPNIWALLGCVAIRMAFGALWYSPVLFLRPWQKMAGVTDKDMSKGMAKAMVTDIVLSLVMVFVLLHAIRYALAPGSKDLAQGLAVSFFNWLGFVLPVQSGIVTYEHKPLRYFMIVSGYQLVTILAMGLVLTLWG